MSDDHVIIQRVYEAKGDSMAADLLISDYSSVHVDYILLV